MKNIRIFLLVLCIVFSSITTSYGAPGNPTLIGQSAILIDATTGKILYEKNSHDQHYPASTTKIMTGILALENLIMTDLVPIDAETPFTIGSRIYLLEGEEVKVEDVLYGLFLESANDAAVALAKDISGSVEDFAVLMNEKAVELGALDTNFVNPNGLHDDNHLTTAYDLAMIAKYAMKNPAFRQYVSTYSYTMEATNLQDTRYLYNTNRLLYDTVHDVVVNGVERPCFYEGVTGIKTGYTGDAGGCLVASAKRGDTELIAVSLASTDMGRFSDCIAMLDYGFENYKTVGTISSSSDLGTIAVKRGTINQVPVVVSEESYGYFTLPIEASESLIHMEVELYDSLKAPFESGQKAGVVKVYAGDELLAEYVATTKEGVGEGGILSIFGISDATAELIGNLTLATIGMLFLLLILYVMVKRRQVKRRRSLRQQERQILRLHKDRQKAKWEEEYWKTRL